MGEATSHCLALVGAVSEAEEPVGDAQEDTKDARGASVGEVRSPTPSSLPALTLNVQKEQRVTDLAAHHLLLSTYDAFPAAVRFYLTPSGAARDANYDDLCQLTPRNSKYFLETREQDR